MYCVNCGVKLADTEKQCPLCGVKVYHPEIVREAVTPLYPQRQFPSQQVSSGGVKVILTALFLLSAIITLLCDLQISGGVGWSDYVVGALALCYVVAVLPCWFRRPNPVIFVPCDFAAVGLYLLYIDLVTPGSWFLSFAFPVTGGICVIVTAVVTLLRYVRGGRLYVFGGALIALGVFMPVVEFLLCVTFEGIRFAVWSFYPLAALVILGGMLIFLAICQRARETMERKFFV